MSDATLHAIGERQFWGFSPGIDLLEAYEGSEEEVNCLTIGAYDVRHVIQTLAKQAEKKDKAHKKVNFYMVENNLECLARHILFVSIILDQDKDVEEKVKLFLEIHGNLYLRDDTQRYLEEHVQHILDYLVSDKGPLVNILNLKRLKHRERDMIEKIVKSWVNPNPQTAEIMKKMHDERLRFYHKDRYEVRTNLFDWDYHWNLAVRDGAGIIHLKEYVHWRNTGVAYRMVNNDDAYGHLANSTLFANKFADKSHQRVVRGFFGDMVNSPYFSYGVYTDNKMMQEKDPQGRFTHTSIDVARDNLKKWFSSFSDYPSFQLFPMMVDNDKLYSLSAYKSKFNVVFFGMMHAQWLKTGYSHVCRDNTITLTENGFYLVPIKDEHRKAYTNQIIQLATPLKLKLVDKRNGYLIFK